MLAWTLRWVISIDWASESAISQALQWVLVGNEGYQKRVAKSLGPCSMGHLGTNTFHIPFWKAMLCLTLLPPKCLLGVIQLFTWLLSQQPHLSLALSLLVALVTLKKDSASIYREHTYLVYFNKQQVLLHHRRTCLPVTGVPLTERLDCSMYM